MHEMQARLHKQSVTWQPDATEIVLFSGSFPYTLNGGPTGLISQDRKFKLRQQLLRGYKIPFIFYYIYSISFFNEHLQKEIVWCCNIIQNEGNKRHILPVVKEFF